MDNLILESVPYPRCLQLEINRPKELNALSGEVIEQLTEKLERLKSEFFASKEIQKFDETFPRLMIISGSGEKAFVAGADIQILASEGAEKFLEAGISLMALLESFPIPTLAFVDGYCLGGGLELALSCDLIAATESSQLGLPEITLGIIPGFGGTQRLLKRSGLGVARRMILSGMRIRAEEAYKFGIVDVILSKELLGDQLRELALKFTNLSPLSAYAAKRALFLADTESRAQGLAGERNLFLELLSSADAKEGLQAFLMKRTPTFNGN